MKISSPLPRLQNAYSKARAFLSSKNLRRSLLFGWIRLRAFLRNDRTTKRNCLFVAIALFFFIQLVLNKEKSFSVKVVPSFDADHTQAISKIEPQEVTITIRGPRDAIQSFHDTQNVILNVSARPDNLKGQKLKLSRFQVKGIHDRSLSVVKIEPRRVTVVFDEQITKEVPVTPPSFVNEPLLKDYSVNISNITSSITVRGPKSILDSISDSIVLRTESIDLRGRSGDFKTSVRILDLPYTDRVKWEQTEITTDVSLSDTSVSNAFDQVNLLLAAKSGDASRYVSEPETVRVWVKGSKSAVDSVKAKDIVAIATCSGPQQILRNSGIESPVRATLTHGYQDLTLWTEPAAVRVFIQPDPEPKPSTVTKPEPEHKPVAEPKPEHKPEAKPEPSAPAPASPAPTPIPDESDAPPPPEAKPAD